MEPIARPAVLLVSAPDRPGLVAAVARAVLDAGGNVARADQHIDRSHGVFLQRLEIEPGLDTAALRAQLSDIAADLQLTWTLHEDPPATPMAILVSRDGHCLYDLLSRVQQQELPARVVLVASNHDTHGDAAARFDVPFVRLPPDADAATQETALRDAVDASRAELVVLARYMRVLSPALCDHWAGRVINIHHSFLPAFAGARAYHQAHARGVKLIGATAHYATADLDEGPIITQDVVHVSHRDDPEDLRRRGRDLERVVLARAVRLHLEHRVLLLGSRTVVFD